ncbi:tRNA (adenosine(37)-N6)-threonylcarbamoyltransferase complex ATPase subunit type 1 TsaE [Candidatus Saccharibacteria bacterium]|nr:tRNA (adenosine(37)-N6)-threonylcarbamoyltransferase complex ATPase subunit type 1 TsaE [Candidatus Saccharibacteria bacterium]
MIWQTVSTSSDDTQRLGQLLGRLIKSPEIIELRSDLGGGKTTFVKGLARGLGSKDTVTSPSFTLNRIYQLKGNKQVHHYDFYRLSEAGIMSDELAESLQDPNVVTVMEWSDIVQNILPKKHLIIKFMPTANDPNVRKITISYPESKIGLMGQLETNWTEIKP